MTGYPHPVIIGGRSDGAGNWEWSDGSNFDLTFMQAHSGDMKDGAPNPIEGTAENKLVFYWGEAGYSSDPLHGGRWRWRDQGYAKARFRKLLLRETAQQYSPLRPVTMTPSFSAPRQLSGWLMSVCAAGGGPVVTGVWLAPKKNDNAFP